MVEYVLCSPLLRIMNMSHNWFEQKLTQDLSSVNHDFKVDMNLLIINYHINFINKLGTETETK